MRGKVNFKKVFLAVVMCTFLALCTSIGSMNVYAAGAAKTFVLPLTYANNAGKSATVNLTMTYSTDRLQKGTVITLTGLPVDSASTGGAINCGFVEVDSKSGNILTYQLFGGNKGTAYANGTVTYTMKNAKAGAALTVGARTTSSGSNGSDGYYLLDESGQVGDLYTGQFITATAAPAATPAADTSGLANASVNNAEFNAKVYYDNNPDLQTAIGPDAQALYNHWVNNGKKEGRKAK